jgi:hypothetical protein
MRAIGTNSVKKKEESQHSRERARARERGRNKLNVASSGYNNAQQEKYF